MNDSLRIEPIATAHPDAQAMLGRYYDELRSRFGMNVAAPPGDMDPPGGAFFIAYEGDKPVASGGIRSLELGTCEIKRMYVEPDARRRGYARVLLDALEARAREMGFRRVVLDTIAGLGEANSLYEKSGYQRVAAYNDNPHATVWFEKALDGAPASSGAAAPNDARGPATTTAPRDADTQASPLTRPSGDIEHLARLYREMLLIRRAEEESARAYAEGKIGGFLHLYIGQEAVAVGALAALEPTDYVITTYRDHGIALAKGMSPRALIAELYGKATGCSHGLGGSMHMFDKEHHMLGGYGIVGSHIPVAAGVAFACKYRSDKRVTVCFFGEGAVSIGGFHEGLSLAALWKLPIVFVCENNEYSMGTPLARSMSVEDVSLKALAYGMDRDRFFADDVLDVERRIAEAVKRAREQSLPTLVEVRTYRFRGHSMSDPAKYRTQAELEEHKKRDPLFRARTALEAQGYGDARLQALEQSVEADIVDAIQFAVESPEPTLEDLEPTTYSGKFAY
jgi:pyruvate dehydrogenase E1 component alpha subunit